MLHTQQGLRTTFPFLKQNILFSKTHFFPSAIFEWNKLDPSLRNSESFLKFKKNIIQLLILCVTVIIVKELNLLRDFVLVNPYILYATVVIYWIHNLFFLHFPLFTNERCTLLTTLNSINCNLLNITDLVLTQILLFGNLSFNSNKNLRYYSQLLIIYYQLKDYMKTCFKPYFVATDLIQVINIFFNMT